MDDKKLCVLCKNREGNFCPIKGVIIENSYQARELARNCEDFTRENVVDVCDGVSKMKGGN